MNIEIKSPPALYLTFLRRLSIFFGNRLLLWTQPLTTPGLPPRHILAGSLGSKLPVGAVKAGVDLIVLPLKFLQISIRLETLFVMEHRADITWGTLFQNSGTKDCHTLQRNRHSRRICGRSTENSRLTAKADSHICCLP